MSESAHKTRESASYPVLFLVIMSFQIIIKEIIMRHILILLSSLLVVSAVQAKDFSLSSKDLTTKGFTDKFVANIFGCSGDNISPELVWHTAPAGTKSFVVTLYDPDAPTGSGFWHWVVANVPANVNRLAQGVGNQANLLPTGAVMIRNDYGRYEYGGPCPPPGRVHRYQFTVYALDIEHIDVPANASAAYIGFIANMHTIDKTVLEYTYSR